MPVIFDPTTAPLGCVENVNVQLAATGVVAVPGVNDVLGVPGPPVHAYAIQLSDCGVHRFANAPVSLIVVLVFVGT